MLPITRRTKSLLDHSIEHLKLGSESDLQIALLHADNSVEILLKYHLRFKKNIPPVKLKDMSFYTLVDESKDLKIIEQSRSYFLIYHDMRNSVWHDGLMIPPKDDVRSATSYAKQLFNELFPENRYSDIQTTLPSKDSINNLQRTFGEKDYLTEISQIQQIIILFEKQGYETITEHGLSDTGIDLIARKKTHIILCEIKGFKRSNIGSHIINWTNYAFQQYIERKVVSNVEKWLISDASFVKPAIEMARTFNIQLIKVRDINNEIRKLSVKYEDRESKKDIFDLFDKFINLTNFTAGEGIIEKSTHSWMKNRRSAKDYFQKIFHVNHLLEMSEDEFSSFLYFRNNRSWTSLYRQGRQLLSKLDDVKKAIAYLQDNEVGIETRLRRILRPGDLHVRGFGKNMVTGILHILDENDQYGVWNNVTETGLKHIQRKPPISSDPGISYVRINKELLNLKNELGTDLVMIDGLLWYIVNYHSEKTKKSHARF